MNLDKCKKKRNSKRLQFEKRKKPLGMALGLWGIIAISYMLVS